jgi:hypothetical protein
MKATRLFSISFSLLFSATFFSQEKDLGTVSGNFQTISQYYNEDTLINAILPDHKMGLNSFANINYTRGNFSAGVRYESYLNPIEGYPTSFKGSGLGYRYVNWKNKDLDVTVGNFYEQFGSGLILRAYEERNLGIDNALDGVRLKYTPYKGVYLKAFTGKQRYIFQDGLTNGNGLIRGFDGEINLNELLDSAFNESKLLVTIGGSFVSRYNEDNLTPNFIMPKNVGSYGGRIGLRYGKVRFSGEYIIKENDPYPDSQDDRFNYIYKNGEGILLNLGYSTKGFAIDLSAKHNDNMLWRSTNVTVGPTDLLIGYVPTLTKQHTYSLASTLYPYATNARGEVAFQADVIYRIPKKTKLGGKYGTVISLNYATAYAPKREYLADMTTSRKGYKTTPFSMTDSMFVQDFNLEIKRKFNKKLKASVNYFNFVFDDRAILVAKNHELIFAQIFVLDITQTLNKKHSIRYEAQHLATQQDQGNWAFGQIEYTYGSHWSFAILDQYNYGNRNEVLQLHYLLGNIGYVTGPHRFSCQYGRQRAGIFCVGGVCRAVPASNGFTFTVTSSF